MSPKKKRKLKHQAHEEVLQLYIPCKFHKGPERRGIRKFITGTIDVNSILDWESDNYEEVYN